MDVPILFLWSQETKRHFHREFAQRLTGRSALAAAARAAESPNSGAESENNLGSLMRICREYDAWVLGTPKDPWC